MAKLTENTTPEIQQEEKPGEVVLKMHYKKRFEDAVADAQYMMIYASSNLQNDIDQGTIERLIKARQSVEKGEELSVEDEAGFWLDYQELWKLIQPATAESIKANLPIENTSTSKARRTVNGHIFFTVFVLILLLIFQIYWVIGNQLTTQAAELSKKEAELTLELSESQREYSELEIRYKQTEMESETFSGAYYFYYTPEWERDILDNTTKRATLETNLELLKSQLERSSAILTIWSRPWKGLIEDEVEVEEGSLAHNDKYAPQFDFIDGQIRAINEEISNDPIGLLEAESQMLYLTTQASGINGQLDVFNEQYASLDSDGRIVQAKLSKIEQKSALELRLTELTASQSEIQNQIDSTNSQLSSLPPDADASTRSDLETRLNDLANELANLQLEITNINNQLIAFSDDANVVESRTELESQLTVISENKTAVLDQIQYLQSQIQSLVVDPQVLAQQIVSERRQAKSQWENERRILERQEKADADREKARREQFQNQLAGQFVLVILQSYMLPLLYGILGASTSVLRTLSKQIETVTYSQAAGNQHLLRISLGALAGIMVGWFSFLIPGETTTFVGSISPLAIAFLVGYNIELFFSLMDRALFSITDRLQRPSPVKEEEPQTISENPPTSPARQSTPSTETPDTEESAG